MRLKGRLCNTDLYIKEHLTAKNNSIFFHCRTAKKMKVINHTWTDTGRVYVTEKYGDAPKLMKIENAYAAQKEQHPDSNGPRDQNPQHHPAEDSRRNGVPRSGGNGGGGCFIFFATANAATTVTTANMTYD